MVKNKGNQSSSNKQFITFLVIIIAVLLFIGFSSNSSAIVFIAVLILAIAITTGIIFRTTGCPKCHKFFVKKIVKKEKIGEEVIPYTYRDTIQYLYSDGSIKKEVDGDSHTIDEHWEINRFNYTCKACNNKWQEKKEFNLDDGKRPEPKIEVIRTRDRNPNSDYNGNKRHHKIRVPIPAKKKRALFERAGHRCQKCTAEVNLRIHHIDKNPANNSFKNLIVLCPSDHARADNGALRKEQLKSLIRKQTRAGKIKYV